MSAPAIALPPGPSGSPAKPKKRKSSSGPSVSDRILKVVAASSERGGLSLAALKKNLKAGGYDVVKNNSRIRAAIKRLKAKKVLVQTKGSFKLNKKPPKKKVVKKRKPKPKKAKKAGAKKAKKAGAKKAKKAGAKKAGAKKKKKSTSPKKAAKKAGAAKKKRASPKKTARKGPKKAKRATKSKAAAKK